LTRIKYWSLFLLLLTAVLVAGCVPRGGVTNPGWTVLTASDGVVYAALATGQVVALDDQQDGQEAWKYPATAPSSGIGCSFAQTGNSNAEQPLDAVYGPPALAGDALIVASYDGSIYVFDRETGASRRLFTAQDAVIGGVAVYEGIAYFGSADHHVYAVRIDNGEMAWAEPFATGNSIWGTPAVDDKRIYVGSMDHMVYALDRLTGQLSWKRDVGAAIPGSVTLADGYLLVGGVNRDLYALDAETGEIAWGPVPLQGWYWGEALVRDGYVYCTSLDGHVYAFSLADGTPRWDAPVAVDGAVRAGPVLLNDAFLLVGTETGKLYTILLENGDKRVVYGDQQGEQRGSILSRPVVVGSKVFVGTTTANVYALDFSHQVPVEAWVYPKKEK